MDPLIYQECLDFALDLAEAAAAQIMPHYLNHTVSLKADGTEVTVADREAELVMRELIRSRYPTHGIWGEEFGIEDASSSYHWVLDPVDGTSWFTLGVPLFGTLIALVQEEEPLLGVIHLPVVQETVYAARGLGCWFKTPSHLPSRIQVETVTDLGHARVSSSGLHGSTLLLEDGHTAYDLPGLIQQAGKFKICGDCSQYTLVCRGKIHAAVDTVMKPWDIAALVPCVEEAGGKVTSLSGQREKILEGGSLLASCGGPLHDQILEQLQPRS